jgi:hypothetical protein
LQLKALWAVSRDQTYYEMMHRNVAVRSNIQTVEVAVRGEGPVRIIDKGVQEWARTTERASGDALDGDNRLVDPKSDRSGAAFERVPRRSRKGSLFVQSRMGGEISNSDYRDP